MKNTFCFLFFLFISNLISQERRVIEVKRFDKPPKIDGLLDDDQWSKSIPATKFERWQPNNGQTEQPGYENFVYMGYDDNAIYIGGVFKNPNPIPVEFSQRDNIWEVNAETFFISINPYDDNTNYQGFQITSSGTVGDTFTSEEISPEDWDFDTVFESDVKIINSGWSAELKIPYSALRFPSKNIQTWAINFGRKIVETGEIYTWNYVDNETRKFAESKGLTSELKNISPPLRLFFYPYIQSSIDLKKGSSPLSAYSAGMDLKYGISNSFTLDATLIPDFGQVTFDDEELNLSPFEQEFDENRAFFTEGASLFKKADGGGSGRSGNFFYSRRIGEEVNFNENDVLDDNESLIGYDSKPDLINSVKLTGTTNSGLSVGLINSITNTAYARIKNNLTNRYRKEMISPLTNYNVITLTQQIINEFSTITFSNANVNRSGFKFKNSNNSAFVFDLFDNKRKFNVIGNLYSSYSPANRSTKGFRGALRISEITGNFRYSIGWRGVDANYYQNDLGFYRFINSQSLYTTIRYQTFTPSGWYENFNSYLYVSERSRFFPKIRKSRGFRLGNNITLLNLHEIEFDIDYTSEYKNYDEPRKTDTFIIDPAEVEFQFSYNSDNRKKLKYGIELQYLFANGEDFNENKTEIQYGAGIGLRANDKLNLEFELNNSTKVDDVGYVFKENNNVYFGLRDVKSIENNFTLNYNFDSYKSINLKLRQFWSSAKYDSGFFILNNDGKRELSSKNISDYDPNTNFNLWNFDLGFNWEFAPGSKATLLYRNNLFNQDNLSGISYYSSTKELFQKPINHQISLRINYFIDYNILRKKNK